MNPTHAILLTLLVPGAAHFLLGKAVRGVVALVVTAGMFFAGYALLQDRLFHAVLFQPFDLLAGLFAWVPLNLLPEAPNLGCSIVAKLLNADPQAPAELAERMRMLRLPRDHEHVGFFLTGGSGIVACLFAADAQGLALGQAPARRNRALLAGLSWLLPGAGHYLIGQKDKGVLMGAAVVLMFALGLWFSDGLGVDRAHHSAYWIVQSLFGGGALLASLGFGQLELSDPIPLRYSLGYTLAGIAGLMNLVVMIDAYTVADRGAGTAA
ncbi:MAG: hypothetical protein H6836_06960 [Planctomycetes bacterium]|nr:hypothetical protein [Planctomycetota bacterium]